MDFVTFVAMHKSGINLTKPLFVCYFWTVIWTYPAPMSPVLYMRSLRVVLLRCTTAPNGMDSWSRLMSIPWQEPATTNNGCDKPAHSNITWKQDQNGRKAEYFKLISLRLTPTTFRQNINKQYAVLIFVHQEFQMPSKKAAEITHHVHLATHEWFKLAPWKLKWYIFDIYTQWKQNIWLLPPRWIVEYGTLAWRQDPGCKCLPLAWDISLW